MTDASVRTCENFLYFFTDEVAAIRQLAIFSNLNVDLLVAAAHSAVFEQIELVSIPTRLQISLRY